MMQIKARLKGIRSFKRLIEDEIENIQDQEPYCTIRGFD